MYALDFIEQTNDMVFNSVKGKTPLTDALVKTYGSVDIDTTQNVDKIKDKAHEFITKGIYDYQTK